MEISNDIIEAARRLGATLGADPTVQNFRAAKDAIEQDAEVRQLEADVERVYNELVGRQQAGEMLSPREVNDFYQLRERLTQHPLMLRYGESLQAMRALCEQTGGAISSVLSVDYTQLVLGE